VTISLTKYVEVDIIASEEESDSDDNGSAFHSSSDESPCNVYP